MNDDDYGFDNGVEGEGRYYKKGNNYNGVDFCQILPEERKHFSYNFDALDALLYKKYDSKNARALCRSR